MTDGAVSLLNNELGFRVKDIRGIADIRKSKKKGKAGYTGGSKGLRAPGSGGLLQGV